MITDLLLQFFLAAILECLLTIFTIYIIAKKPFDVKKIVVSGIFMAIASAIVCIMPISFGVHTVILSIAYIAVSVLYNKIEVKKSILGVLTALTIVILSEVAGVLFLVNIIKVPVDASEWGKFKLQIPSKIIYIAAIYIFYNIYYVKNGDK